MPWLECSRRLGQFEQTREFLARQKRWARFPETYQGYAKAIQRDGGQLTRHIWEHFQRQLPELAGNQWRWKSYVPLAVDGSRLECPRTPANEQAFGCAGRDHTGPQVMLTVLYHLGTALPYAARVGPGTTSEQTQIHAMLDELPQKTLLLSDAGFFSAQLARELIARGHRFLLRVGGNKQVLLELLDECEFGLNQQVWVWTEEMRRKKQPPLSLRLIEIETDNPESPNVFLLTNLSAEELSDGEAGELYQRRWGIEIFFRGAKQTLESRKLKSRNPELALAEAMWLVLSVFLLGSLAVREQPKTSVQRHRWSAAEIRRVVCDRMRNQTRRGGRWSKSLANELRACLIDDAPRHGPKSTRRHPQKKKERPPSPPKRRPATQTERQLAAQLQV